MNRTGQLDRLLDDLVARAGAADRAVILSSDGMIIGASAGLSREDTEHLCAVAAGIQSLARGAGRRFGAGEPRQSVVELESAFLFVTEAGEGTCLAVLARAGADAGAIAHEMAVVAGQIRDYLSAGDGPVFTDPG